MKNYKQKSIKNLVITVNGNNYNLGNLVTIIKSYSPTSKKQTISYKCLHDGKTFTNTNDLSIHLVNYLVSSKRVIL